MYIVVGKVHNRAKSGRSIDYSKSIGRKVKDMWHQLLSSTFANGFIFLYSSFHFTWKPFQLGNW